MSDESAVGGSSDNRDFRWVLDVSPVVAVMTLLVGTYLLPTSVQRELVFDYSTPTVLTAYTAPFVHFSASHLVSNLAAFVLVAGTIYSLSVGAERRRVFFMLGATLLIAFPVSLSVLNLAVPREGITYGFSGMNMALVGFLPIVIATYAERRLGYLVDGVLLLVAFFVSASYIAAIAVPWTTYSAVIAVTAAVLALGFVLQYVVSIRDCLEPIQTLVEWCGGAKTIVVVGIGIWGALLWIGFPESVADDGAVINIYVHFIGYALGFITAYLAYEWQLIGERPIEPLSAQSREATNERT
jgi:hypothetical protein